jgi:hypothetical protein
VKLQSVAVNNAFAFTRTAPPLIALLLVKLQSVAVNIASALTHTAPALLVGLELPVKLQPIAVTLFPFPPTKQIATVRRPSMKLQSVTVSTDDVHTKAPLQQLYPSRSVSEVSISVPPCCKNKRLL